MRTASKKVTAERAATLIRTYVKKLGYEPDEIAVFQQDGVWKICWEGGPFEWAPALSMGSSITSGELNNWSNPAEIDIIGLAAKRGHYFECYNNCTLGVYDR